MRAGIFRWWKIVKVGFLAVYGKSGKQWYLLKWGNVFCGRDMCGCLLWAERFPAFVAGTEDVDVLKVSKMCYRQMPFPTGL